MVGTGISIVTGGLDLFLLSSQDGFARALQTWQPKTAKMNARQSDERANYDRSAIMPSFRGGERPVLLDDPPGRSTRYCQIRSNFALRHEHEAFELGDQDAVLVEHPRMHLTVPRSGLDRDSRTSRTSVSANSVSPWNTGAGWLSASVARLAIALPEMSDTLMPSARRVDLGSDDDVSALLDPPRRRR